MKWLLLVLFLFSCAASHKTTFIWFPSQQVKETWKKYNPNVKIIYEEKDMIEIEVK